MGRKGGWEGQGWGILYKECLHLSKALTHYDVAIERVAVAVHVPHLQNKGEKGRYRWAGTKLTYQRRGQPDLKRVHAQSGVSRYSDPH